MIDPATISPETLPSVPLENRIELPTESCIYFAIDSQGVVQYIGRTANLKQRWSGHHQLGDLSLLSGVRIAYLSLDGSLLVEVEKALISWFKPPLNKRLIVFCSKSNNATITCTKAQRKIWRQHCHRLGVTDAQLLSHVLPMLDQLVGVQ